MKRYIALVLVLFLYLCSSNVCSAENVSDGPLSVMDRWKKAVEGYPENKSFDDILDCFTDKEVFDQIPLGNYFFDLLWYYSDVHFFDDQSVIVAQTDTHALIYYSCGYTYISDNDPEAGKKSTREIGMSYVEYNNGQWRFSKRVGYEDTYFSIIEWLESDTVYVKKGNFGYRTDVLSLEYGAWTQSALKDHAFGDPYARVSLYPTLKRSDGDMLITTKNTSKYTLRKVDDILYCYPALLKEMYAYAMDGTGSLITTGLKWNHSFMPVSTPGDWNGIAEVNGYEVVCCDDLELILQDEGVTVSDFSDSGVYGLLLTSNEQAELKIGYFSGTVFCEEDIQLEYSLYCLGEKYQCPVQKTKNGYFIVDTSSLEAGYYVIEDGYNWYSLNLIQISD